MKKLNIMASALSTVAIAGGVLFANSVEACIFSNKSQDLTSKTSLISLNSWLSKNFPNKSDFAIAGTATGAVGLMGLSAFFAARYLNRKVEANTNSSNDSLELSTEETLIQQHPEAPGGELDLVQNDGVDPTDSEVLSSVVEKEIFIAK
ncbi:MAG: hypothetical protein AB4080_19430 [Trichodesmium sp.]